MAHETRFIRRFDAVSDSGDKYTVREYQDFVSNFTGGGTFQEMGGLKTWKTTTGLVLEKTANPKVFTIVTTNETIKEV
jgi:hypothetical protein